jgi:hypothetical protein
MRVPAASTEKQIARIRAKWKNISRLGMPLFVLTRGTILFARMCLCYVGFIYLYGRLRLLHQAFVIESSVPCLLLLSYTFPIAGYWMVSRMIHRIGPEQT